MTKYIYCAAIFFLTCADICTSQTLRIMSYNTHHCAGSDNVTNEEQTASVIAACSPDVIAVQELDSCNGRSVKYQAAELGKYSQMKATYGRTIAYKGGSYGIGILSKETPLSVKRVPLPGQEARALLICEFEDYYFACTHLCHKTQANRINAMSIILEQARLCDKPFFIAGDFNCKPTSSEMITFKKNFKILSNETQSTYPATTPTSCIDYIAVYKGNIQDDGIKILKQVVVNEPKISDHRPLYVTLQWPPENTGIKTTRVNRTTGNHKTYNLSGQEIHNIPVGSFYIQDGEKRIKQ